MKFTKDVLTPDLTVPTSCSALQKEIVIDPYSGFIICASFISEDNLYGNFVFEVNEITKDISANGTLIAYLERPAGENNPQRWSQFPQYCLACNDDEDQAPSFTYFSYGEGIVRISMQSKTDVRPMAEVLKGKKIKITIIN